MPTPSIDSALAQAILDAQQAIALRRQVEGYERQQNQGNPNVRAFRPEEFLRSTTLELVFSDEDTMSRLNKFTLKPIPPQFTTELAPNRFVGVGQILRGFRALPKTKGVEVVSSRHEKWQRLERIFRAWVNEQGYKYGLKKSVYSRREQILKICKKWFKCNDLVWVADPHDLETNGWRIGRREDCIEVYNNNLRSGSAMVFKADIKENKDYFQFDELQQIWYYHTSASNYVIYKNGRKTSVRFGQVHNWKKHITKCGGCKVYVLIKDCIEDLLTEQRRCEKCRELPPHKNNNDFDSSTASDIVKSYHGHGSGWQIQIARLDEKDLDIPFGIELEIHSKLGNSVEGANQAAYAIAKAQREHNKDWNYFYFERDGSLMEGGFEMITQPMTLGFHRQFWGVMLPKIRGVAVGWNTYQLMKEWGMYGIHITFSRRHWSDYDLARLVKFLDNPDNAWFVRGIAQRDRQYKTEDGTLLAQKKRGLIDRITLKDKKIFQGRMRNQPVNIKQSMTSADGLCEVRIFRSTLNTESFFKNIEFLHAFRMWCKESPFRIGALDFVMWLSKSQRAQASYPNLIGYLSRPKFPCRGTKGIKNPIATHFKHVKGIAAPLDVSKATVEDRMKEDLESCAS